MHFNYLVTCCVFLLLDLLDRIFQSALDGSDVLHYDHVHENLCTSRLVTGLNMYHNTNINARHILPCDI